MGIIEFLDQHSGSLTVIITLVYVVATVMICWANFRSAKASREQLLEMRKQYEEDNRPRIGVEFLFENRTYYGLRFVNTGKAIAQRVRIQFEDSFIDSIENKAFSEALKLQKGKECIIGIGQHYDMFFGESESRENPNQKPATGMITYRDSMKEYSEPFFIDLKQYMSIYSVTTSEDRLMEKLMKQNQQLEGIRKALEKK